jgi:pimeloyl-ACP methyl ester carboxylesterase
LKIRILFLSFILSSLSCGGGAQNSDRAPLPRSTPGLSQALIDEPVFAGKVHVVEAGPQHASTVVLLHGIGDIGANDWNRLIPELAKSHRVLAFDLPGFGRSSRKNERYTPDAYVRFVKWLVGERGVDSFYLVGHSMGATLAILYASTYPEDVKKLVVADAAGILEHHSLIDFWVSERSLSLKRMSRRSGNVLGWANNLLLEIGDKERLHSCIETKAAREKYLDGSPKKIAGTAFILRNFGLAIDSIESPTLIIWGQEDTIAPIRVAKILSNSIQGARLEVIEGVGHIPMVERPVLFNDMVLDFLRAEPQPDTHSKAEKQNADSIKKGRCEGRRNMVFTGDYSEIDITGCEIATLRNVRTSKLTIARSTVIIEQSEISGSPIAFQVKGSEVVVTSSIIRGDVAIHTTGSILDIAGSKIVGKKSAVEVAGSSEFLFSVCQAESPNTSGYLHGLHSLRPGDNL